MRIDLATLQPDPVVLVHDGVEYHLPAVMRVEVAVEAAKIDADVQRLHKAGEIAEAAKRVIDLKRILLDQIDVGPDEPPVDLPLSGGQVMQLLGLLNSNDEAGFETFRRVVAAQMEGAPGDAQAPAPDPFGSPKSSRKRSSRSAGGAASRRAGTAA